ncbi:PepSY domain-containing protein [Neisseria leonii]|uniref:PepSY domain-containing protein n=1 Tax=Neisseria leonii TaxID=2995413 RepID=UPI00237AA1FC|nr:PepSY domain-containing protein [Neisseria sp. 3986]MDD9324989.1 PepSY domain-containing protein [Neisseria sp. 3986]
MKKILLTALLTASTAAFADSAIERQMQADPNLEQNRARAVQLLEARGYTVTDIDADDYRGKPAFEVEAVKNGREYDIILSYPDLTILKEKRDY